jgi:hypothetical protein
LINTPDPNGRPVRFSKSVGKGSGAMVYGVIMYDFKAERADELDAKEGEAIIVIAQSNPEWFVAKPIGRLGGPGLIPVSFIEIRDMSSGQAVPDAQEAVQRAGVPKVEEWKKMAADYKNSSISLGKFDIQPGTQQPMQGGDMDPHGGYGDGGQMAYGTGQNNGDYVSILSLAQVQYVRHVTDSSPLRIAEVTSHLTFKPGIPTHTWTPVRRPRSPPSTQSKPPSLDSSTNTRSTGT